jgi:hypothetical protein
VNDPETVYYWRQGFPRLAGNKSIGPVLTRLETFLSPKAIRYMVSQRENRLDFGDILDTGKILLAKLAQGLIGKENSYLLGTLLVSKLEQLTMARQAQTIAVRKDFWLYVDEFHHFITPSMAEILTGARKYRLGLVLAHQELRQLQRDQEVASAVLSNPGTRICFRVGDDDAKKLAEGFSSFEARDLQNLETGQAICRVERSDWDFNLSIPLPEEAPEPEAAQRREEVIAVSRKKYATPRAEIEAALRHAWEGSREAEVERPPLVPGVRDTRRAQRKPAEPMPTPPETAVGPEPRGTEPEAPEGDMSLRSHEALKERIRREAEALDYTVSPEKLILDGHGQVDLVLERGRRSIACEISAKNTVGYEVGNVRKCLEAGFAHIAVICADERKLGKIREALKPSLSAEETARIAFYLPHEFNARLCDWAARDPAPVTAHEGKPKKQRIRLFGALSDAERKEREVTMLAGLAEAMKRKRNP